jgi:K+-dependent Na+/Ca+ exchanger-like protein
MVATASRYAGRTPAARRHRSVARLGVFACAFLVAVVCFGASSGALGSDVDAGSSRSGSLRAASGRAMLESDGDGSLYPPDAFTESQLKRGAVFLHAFGVLYTFVAIAIVCDDFFVPALEVLVERYGIDDDVAGATFMAAGGSAPELFTALIGVFIAKSNVGFGTIIGSAVFNVLFVIGACAFFSRETLSLTWWPLARDCAFYVLDLVVLFVFFLDQKIEVYESLTLLALYVCYVFFMKHNQRAERWFKTRVLRVKPSDFDREKVQDAARKAMDREAAEAHIEAERLKSLKNADTDSVGHSSLASGRSGSLRSASSRQLSRKLRGNSVRGALSLLDADGRPQSPGILATEPAVGPGHPALIGVGSAGSKPHGNKVSAEPAPFDFGVDKNELRKAAAERARAAMDAVSAAEDEDDEGIDLSWPEDRGGQVYYVIACPLMFLLAYTIPNCKKRPTLWPVVFLLSILYIGVFSYFMVWWATSVGAVAGISDVVMGYTFLAAGTSVPDLMSSVIVARQGLGDMAVSSSIGSNIFDITFGLPLPWLIWSLANGFETFPVNSDSLGFSLTLLIIMLVAVVSIIAQQGWMMTKTLGAMMVALYGVFLLLVLLNAGGHVAGF